MSGPGRRRAEWLAAVKQPHPWFAWRPVRLEAGGLVWLRWVTRWRAERTTFPDAFGDGYKRQTWAYWL